MKTICESPVRETEENKAVINEVVIADIAGYPQELKKVYQKEVLLESAERLLENTRLSVKEIAENLRLPVETVQSLKTICESPARETEENEAEINEVVKADIVGYPEELKKVYQKEVLLESAERLLENTRLSVKEIAENLRLPVEAVQSLRHSLTIRSLAYVEEHEDEIRAKAEELMEKHLEKVNLGYAKNILKKFPFISVEDIADSLELPIEKIEELKQTIESS